MFFYGNGDVLSVVVSLSELETGALLLGQPAAPLNPEYARWDEWSAAIARAMETGGRIHLTVERDAVRPPLSGWQGPLIEAPEPYRTDATAALFFFSVRHSRPFDPSKVEIVGLDGAAKPKTGP